MSKEIYISSTPHETRLAIVEKDELTEIYYERENEYTLAGSIYNGRVTRVLPGMQSSFVDIGLERDAFLYITDFMEETEDPTEFEAEGGARRDGGRREGRGDHGRKRREEPRARENNGEAASTEEEEVVEGVSVEGSAEEVGEGAPGADGSRRWRGRRGRRRGRGGNGANGGEVPAETQPAAEESFEATDSSDVDVEAAPQESREPREERGQRGGRDRGRDRGRGPREDRNRQDGVRERFAPRGPRYASEDSGAPELAPDAEPFILPGESLSKYRRGEGSAEAEATPAAGTSAGAGVTRPSTEFEVTGWDGGFVLPGETLSRRSRADSPAGIPTGNRAESEDATREQRSEEERAQRGRDRRRERDARRGRAGGEESQSFSPAPSLDPAEAVQPAVTSAHEPEGYVLPLSDDAPAFEVNETELRLEAEQHVAEIAATEVEPEPVASASTEALAVEAVAEMHEVVEEFSETTTEYEPEEDASASFRIDPSGTREFRQSSSTPEAVVVEEHAFTAVQPTGEMISEVEHVEESAHESVAAPIVHELVVQSVTLAEAEKTTQPLVESADSDPLLFAPGEGELEEELLDDEDSDHPVVYADATDEELEEETLEGAADLGTMLREMSIDQITGTNPAELDEDEDYDIDDELEEDELEASTEDEQLDSEDEFSGSDVSETEEDEFAVSSNFEGLEEETPEGEAPSADGEPARRDGQRRGRRDGRRGRARGASRGPSNSRGNGRPNRHSVQATDLPAISDLLKPGQEVLVQIAKEPIAKKGARITSHIALPGRFLVFMPTVNHTGVSRKIESDGERRRLKEILLSEKGDASGGFIVRTAASGASEEELRSDLRFLLNLWADIKARSESSKSPALIYHDLNLVERILRDQVTDNFSAIWVDTESEYERVLRFLQRFQPSLIRRVKLYTKDTPLFEQFGITEEINKALRSKVWLKSGGSIVINQTEALVAIDINTGKYVGKTARLEDTIVKTNLDAIPEFVRQSRLRDLGGIIIIDFIDMDERKNRQKVMQALEEELKKDRAPSKVLQFNDFGLVAITRKRVKQSLERTLSTTCGICAGTGMVKAPVTVCNEIYIELRKMHKHLEKGDIMLRVNPEVVKQLKAGGGKWLQEMEELSGKTILVKSDPSLHPEQFDIH